MDERASLKKVDGTDTLRHKSSKVKYSTVILLTCGNYIDEKWNMQTLIYQLPHVCVYCVYKSYSIYRTYKSSYIYLLRASTMCIHLNTTYIEYITRTILYLLLYFHSWKLQQYFLASDLDLFNKIKSMLIIEETTYFK